MYVCRLIVFHTSFKATTYILPVPNFGCKKLFNCKNPFPPCCSLVNSDGYHLPELTFFYKLLMETPKKGKFNGKIPWQSPLKTVTIPVQKNYSLATISNSKLLLSSSLLLFLLPKQKL